MVKDANKVLTRKRIRATPLTVFGARWTVFERSKSAFFNGVHLKAVWEQRGVRTPKVFEGQKLH